MKTSYFTLLLILSITLNAVHAQKKDNGLSAQEIKQGYQLLFNGRNLEGWTAVGKSVPPADRWKVENGELAIDKKENHGGGDLITEKEYENFDLSVDYKLLAGGNSGIKYLFTRYEKGGWLGQEYQILDNTNHPDAKNGINGNRLEGTLYDVLPLDKKAQNKVGTWNTARIVVKGAEVKHYLNGVEILSYNRESLKFQEAVRQSKFKDAGQFGQAKSGHILLQDHGDAVAFKNIKIKVL